MVHRRCHYGAVTVNLQPVRRNQSQHRPPLNTTLPIRLSTEPKGTELQQWRADYDGRGIGGGYNVWVTEIVGMAGKGVEFGVACLGAYQNCRAARLGTMPDPAMP